MGGRSGQSLPSVKVIVSHSFTNDAGNKVTQYKLTGGFGGFARVEQYKDGFVITNVIFDERARGKGLATKLYEAANRESVKVTGKTLQSIKADKTGKIELSADGRGLWESFVRKGLAKPIARGRYRFIKQRMKVKRKHDDLTKRIPNERELQEVDRVAKQTGKKAFAAWNAKAKPKPTK